MYKKDNFRLVSANSSRYGLTTSIYKSGSQLFMGSYSVDDGQSSLNGKVAQLSAKIPFTK